jgi:hypothetical protein
MSAPLHRDQYDDQQSYPGVSGHDNTPATAPATAAATTTSSLNLNFLKTLTDKRTTRDGNPPKRRGPKPDSKPALTRRQELNRQAQRTHRERKELYIKALEDEVLRLKEIFSNVSQDKEKLAAENKQLKNALAQNGIAISGAGMAGPDDLSVGYTSSASVSVSGRSHGLGSHSTFTPPLTSKSTAPSISPSTNIHPSLGHSPRVGSQQLQSIASQQHPNIAGGFDYEQAGIDFVLTYDDHHYPPKS